MNYSSLSSSSAARISIPRHVRPCSSFSRRSFSNSSSSTSARTLGIVECTRTLTLLYPWCVPRQYRLGETATKQEGDTLASASAGISVTTDSGSLAFPVGVVLGRRAIDQRQVQTTTSSDTTECPACGNEFVSIGAHWGAKPEHRPALTERQKQIALGWMLGDGSILAQSKNAALQLTNTKKEFLEWNKGEFGVLAANSIAITATPEEKAAQSQANHGVEKPASFYPPTYNLHISAHPEFNQFRGWYGADGMELPEEVELSKLALRVWYACDGNLDIDQKIPSARFSLGKEEDKYQKVAGWFEKFGLSPNYSYPYLYMYGDDKERFFDVIGEPLPGYEYKWAFGSGQI